MGFGMCPVNKFAARENTKSAFADWDTREVGGVGIEAVNGLGVGPGVWTGRECPVWSAYG